MNPRASARPGGQSSPKGIRAAGDPLDCPFVTELIPLQFWPAQLATFGTTVTYLPAGDPAQAVSLMVIWVDGVSDEDTWPGRYSHLKVLNSDLPTLPMAGDLVQRNGRTYEVYTVNALAVNASVLVLKDPEAI